MATTIWDHFWVLPDPRMDRTKLHKLEDILTLTLCGIVCGAETWVDIVEFAQAKEDFFGEFLELPHGIPSHDTFGRVFAALDPERFESCFQSWVRNLAGSSKGKLIALDGKTVRRSLDRAGNKAAIHMVSAWVHENRAVFGQVRVDDKSNEITAIPKLLEMLNLKEATVTIDAIGCQKDIAQKIVEGGGDYVLAVKGNQGTLHQDVQEFLDDAIARDFRGVEHDYCEQTEKGHGRIEVRRTWTTDDIDWLRKRHDWAEMRSIAAIDAQRTLEGKTSTERRYFLSSLPARTAQRIAQIVRKHWRVENELHWCLDVCFGEDNSRVRIGHAAENLSRVRRLALTLLKQETSAKIGIKAKRLKAGWNHKYLLKVLGI